MSDRPENDSSTPIAPPDSPSEPRPTESSDAPSGPPAAPPAGDAPQAPRCANCDAGLEGAYCARCGQSADTSIPTLRKLLGEFVDSLYNLDSRVWRTLALLAARPGRLTREYLAGRRASFVAPFRLYLVVSLMYFVTASLLGEQGRLVDIGVPRDAPDNFERARAAAAEAGGAASDCAFIDEIFEPGARLHGRALLACEQTLNDGGRALSDAFSDNLPLMMFMLIPIMAALFKPLYLFTAKRYVEHFVFLLHVHSFYFLFAAVSTLVSAGSQQPILSAIAWWLQVALWLYAGDYAYRALRNVYGQGRALSILKFVVLLFGYLLVMAVTVAAGILLAVLSL